LQSIEENLSLFLDNWVQHGKPLEDVLFFPSGGLLASAGACSLFQSLLVYIHPSSRVWWTHKGLSFFDEQGFGQ
jgi:hypothetical protein